MTGTADGSPVRPTILLIDDGDPKVPDSITTAYEVVRIPTLVALDAYLESMDPTLPPMAALIDVQLGRNDFGLAALFRLRRSLRWDEELEAWKKRLEDHPKKSKKPKPRYSTTPPPTERTVPILFTTTLLEGGEFIEGWSYGDLHTLLCAAACKTGILVCSKESANDKANLEAALTSIHRIWEQPGSGTDKLIGVPHGDLRFVRPVSVVTAGAVASKSLVRVLLGNEYKRRLWISLVHNRKKTENSVNATLQKLQVYFQGIDAPPSATLEGPGKRRAAPLQYALRSFVGGDIGRVAKAWYQIGGSLLDDEVLRTGQLALASESAERADADEQNSAPSDEFIEFARVYAGLLSHVDMADFAEWYLAQNWPE